MPERLTIGTGKAFEPDYHAKTFHLIVNKYNRNDSIDPHQDVSETYSSTNPITSLSYSRGSILTITGSKKETKQRGQHCSAT